MLPVIRAIFGVPSFCGASGWREVWADEFNGDALDNTSWTIDLAGGDSRVRDSMGTVDNVYLERGSLILRSQRQQLGGYNYTSGAVPTQRKHSWRGTTRACVRAMLPGGANSDGVWPAHWLMPDLQRAVCWPSNGEIDIMEMINGDNVLHSTYHWRARAVPGCGDHCANGSTAPGCRHPSIGAETRVTDATTTFHEYAVEYNTSHIAFALDGTVFQTITKATPSTQSGVKNLKAEFFDVPYYMILNTAIGGPWPKPPRNATFPIYHTIDYVRVAQPE